MAGVPYTDEQRAWIRDNYLVYKTTQEVTDAFNEKFGSNRTRDSIRQMGTKLCDQRRVKHQWFTPEEDAWLIENYPKYRSDVLAMMFNERFDHPSSARNLIGRCNQNLGIVSDRQNYKKGETPANILPIGTERKTQTGYIMVKIDDKKSQRGDSATYHENWKFKHILEWEKHHGKMPPKHMIVFLDSNKENLDIDNLYCIPQKIAAWMAQNKWYTDSREHTLTAIKWCELKLALRELEG